jgi:hypothetical protein
MKHYFHPRLHRSALAKNESGLVAIMITLIIMSLLTLVTIGFSRLMLREQRQAIDRQLGAQAFYAAESAINDAIKSGQAIKNDCTSDLDVGGVPIDRNLSAADSVSYSCVTIDNSGGDIVLDSVSSNESSVFQVDTSQVSSMKFSWQDANDADDFSVADANFPRFPSLNDWGDNTGVLRVTIMPVPPGGFNRATMQNLARTYFLYPSTLAAHDPKSVSYVLGGDPALGPGYYTGVASENSSGQVVSGQCVAPAITEPRSCNVEITNLQASNANRYYIRVKSLYRPVKLTITGEDAAGDPVNLPGAQYVIDATGKANDVLKRIQVRVPLSSTYAWPEFVVDSASSICKRLIINPGSANNSDCIETIPNMNDPALFGLD